MSVTIFWEDQRGSAVRGFGPHDLLVACVGDLCGRFTWDLNKEIKSRPKKGVSNVRSALRVEGPTLANRGKVFAVLDRDRVHDLWNGTAAPPSNCMAGIAGRLRQDAPGDYDLVFLIDNVETLLVACCLARGVALPPKKPNPDQRDELLRPALAPGQRRIRDAIRAACPSFDRLVARVADALPSPSGAGS